MAIALRRSPFPLSHLAAPLQAFSGWLAGAFRETQPAPARPVAPPPRRWNGPRAVAPVAAAAQPRPVLRVIRVVDNQPGGRMVISGRMADVCAELDRLAALEARAGRPA